MVLVFFAKTLKSLQETGILGPWREMWFSEELSKS